MERRKLTSDDIDKVRDVEGFPIATDEAIIELSDAPYYTACPNPFIKDFIDEYGTPYEEATDDYHCEPFAADVSEGKADAIYMAHTYHTKVPYKAIMHYILHYTNPNDMVLDGFAGTGMTALAAKMCGIENSPDKASFSQEERLNWGARHACIGDLSPIATFIAHNYLTDVDIDRLTHEFDALIKDCENQYGYLYRTSHESNPSLLTNTEKQYGTINYVVWSDVFLCPHCGNEFVFWDQAIADNKVLKTLTCPSCGAKFKKGECERSQTTEFDKHLGKTLSFAKQVPVLINYTYAGKTYIKKPDREDLNNIETSKRLAEDVELPTDELPDGDNTAQPMHSHGFKYVHQFFYGRSALIFSYYFKQAKRYATCDALKFIATSVLLKTGSKLHNIGFKNGKINLAGAMPNVLYVLIWLPRSRHV